MVFRTLLRVAVLAIAIGSAMQARANSWGNDRSDLWWNPAESGWGVMMVQHQDSIFIATFLYGADGKGTWFNGLLVYDGFDYVGQLIQTEGPSHLGPFNPNAVARKVVGTARLIPDGDHRFTFTYTVDGATVTKNLERLTLAANSLTGEYYGGLVGMMSNCTPASLDGYYTSLANMTIEHTGFNLTVSGQFSNNHGGNTSCSFAAVYSQFGRMGEAVGNYSCTSGETGTFRLDRIEVTENGILATANASSNVCQFAGRFGAIGR